MLLLAALALAGGPDAATAAAFHGAWRLAEPRPAVQARVDAAIVQMLAPFNVVVRNLAQPLVAESATFCDAYRLSVTTSNWSVECDARQTASVGYDRPPSPGTSAQGKPYQVSARWDGAAVVLTFDGDGGVQTVRYRLVDGGLQVDKSMSVEKLETQLSWRMRYVR